MAEVIFTTTVRCVWGGGELVGIALFQQKKESNIFEMLFSHKRVSLLERLRI